MTRSATAGARQVEDVAQARRARRRPAPSTRPARRGRRAAAARARAARRPRRAARAARTSCSSPTKSFVAELVQQPRRAPRRARRTPPSAPGTATRPQPDAVAAQPDRVQRAAQDRQRLGGARRARRADELDARPAGTRASGRGAGAPRGRRGRSSRSAAADRPSGSASRRRRAIGTVMSARSARTSPWSSNTRYAGDTPSRRRAHDALVLDRRRVDLAVAVALEDAAQGLGDRAQLAHLVRQDVARAAGDRVDHTPAGCGSVATRSICAPRSRRRSSMRS